MFDLNIWYIGGIKVLNNFVVHAVLFNTARCVVHLSALHQPLQCAALPILAHCVTRHSALCFLILYILWP